MAMGVSNSSDTMVPVRPQSDKQLVNTSFAIRSSFFCSSPDALLSPASPIIPAMGARATSDEICEIKYRMRRPNLPSAGEKTLLMDGVCFWCESLTNTTDDGG